MAILVIEDEKKTVAFIEKGLKEHGYQVSTCLDGSEGLQLALSKPFDLIVLDIMLPSMDGWQVMKGLRSHGIETPVLFLTARDSVNDRVQGLRLGADDYLVKPFAFSELLARAEAILRRSRTIPVERVKIEDLELDFVAQRTFRSGKEIALPPKEFQLLALLASHPGLVFQKKALAEKIWGGDFDFDTNIVEVTVRRLRQKMDEGFPVKLIHTVRGMGYVLKVENH